MKIIKNIINFLFCRWTKWGIYREDLLYDMVKANPITGWESSSERVLVDVYVKTNKYSGLKKYKQVIKPTYK